MVLYYIMMEYSDSVCYQESVPKQHYVTEKCYNMYQNRVTICSRPFTSNVTMFLFYSTFHNNQISSIEVE